MSNSIKSKVFGSILLISGTQIGAGMLALPITTGVAGFIPAIILFLIVFCFMFANIFVLLEATMYCGKGKVNIISIVKSQLGRGYQLLAWFSFLLLLYAASTAYIAGGSGLLLKEVEVLSGVNHYLGLSLFTLIFAVVAYFGITWIDRLNRLLMAGLGLSYVFSIIFVVPHISADNLLASQPNLIWAALPVVIASFTSHLIIPSIADYLDYDIAKIKKSIIIGSIIPLVFYVLWELAIVGALPLKGANGLLSIIALDDALTGLTHALFAIGLSKVATSNLFFSIFAIITSFLGVILSLCDFLADGLNIKQDNRGRLILIAISCLPPLVIALLFPKSFVAALGYAGVFIAILYIILPVMIVYKARYVNALSRPKYSFPGGRLSLLLLAFGGVIVIVMQILKANGLI